MCQGLLFDKRDLEIQNPKLQTKATNNKNLARIITLKWSIGLDTIQHHIREMNDEPPKDLATRAFQMRVLDEFAAVRREQATFREEVRGELSVLRAETSTMRQDIIEIRAQQSAMAQNLTLLDEQLTSLAARVDERLQETRPIWEAVQVQIQRLGEKLDAILLDFYELRGELKIHGRRIGELERRILS